MTLMEDNQDCEPEVEYRRTVELNCKNKCLSWMHQKRIKLCVWILFAAAGLSIIARFSYLAIVEEIEYDIPENARNLDIEEDVRCGIDQFVMKESANISNKSGRFTDMSQEKAINFKGCRESKCEILCHNATDIYESLHATMKVTSCTSLDVLMMVSQSFPSGILKNMWLASDRNFREVIIHCSNIKTIESEAFNLPMFQNIQQLFLFSMNIINLESDALKGLHRLKILTVKSYGKTFEPAILQPVKETLKKLKLNLHLRIEGNENFLGAIYLNNLQHLDLSFNFFNGSLGKKLFESTPNLKFLIIANSQIQYIEENAFEDLAEQLLFVNLSGNSLTTLAAAVIRPILIGQQQTKLSLANNGWTCNCKLQELAELYKNYRANFFDSLNCKTPLNLRGVSLDKVNFSHENCSIAAVNGNDLAATPALLLKNSTTKQLAQANDFGNATSSDVLKVQGRASEVTSLGEAKVGVTRANSLETDKNSSEEDFIPGSDFMLQLIKKNNSVLVSVEKKINALIMWFSDHFESSVISYDEQSKYYECMRYVAPKLIIGPLQENTTYTFCLINSSESAISPFNCLPLYVPAKSYDNIWISADQKKFTIGMLCLIFLLSMTAGAFIAYFGLRAYPNLLESSRPISLVKQSDRPCYIATISETEYQKQKRKSCTKQNSLKDLPQTPSPVEAPLPYCISAKELESSSSTCCEEILPSYEFADDDYEKPKICHDQYAHVPRRSAMNMQYRAPDSPPPLPKRNSNISDSSTAILNHLSIN